MQAMFLFALYGMFFAIVAGLTGQLSLGVQKLQDRQVEDTKVFMQGVAQHYQDYVTQKSVYIPLKSNQNEYLSGNEVAQNVNWPWSDGNTLKDPWGTDFLVKTIYQDHAIRSGAGISVMPQATGFVIASAGPDRQFSSQVTNRVQSANTINQIMNVEPPADVDDIVYTFNTRRALEERWQLVENAVEELLAIAAYQYQQTFSSATFQNNLESYYTWLYAQSLNQNVANVTSSWKTASSSGYPNWAALASSAPNLYSLAVDINYMTYLDNAQVGLLEENTTLTGGRNTNFSLVAVPTVSIPNNITYDIMALNLQPAANSAWRSSTGVFAYNARIEP